MIIDIFLIAFLIFFILLMISIVVHIIFWVPFVPSSKRVIEKMIAAAELKPGETVFDLGCGDARILVSAEKKAKVKAVGFEIAPIMLLMSFARKFFARSRAEIHCKNFFNADFSKADVIFCYLIPNVMPRLAEKIKKECKKGTRIISNTFHLTGMEPTCVFKKDPALGLPTIYVYKLE